MPILEEEPSLFPAELLAEPLGGEAGEFLEIEDDSVAAERHWWLVHTKARQEKALARQLFGRQIAFFLPLVPKDNLIRGRRVRSLLPLFGGYLFLHATDAQRIDCLATNRVVHAYGVADESGLRTDLLQIHRLIAADAPLTLEKRLMPGQRVRVKSGPFKGTSGLLISRRGESRLLVSIDFIGQGASVEIDDFQVEAI
jgi:transcriptional antiterminator RfaH